MPSDDELLLGSSDWQRKLHIRNVVSYRSSFPSSDDWNTQAWSSGTKISDVSGSTVTRNKHEYLLSYNHPYWREVHQHFPRLDLGSEFTKLTIETQSQAALFSLTSKSASSPTTYYTFDGGLAHTDYWSVVKKDMAKLSDHGWLDSNAPAQISSSLLDAAGTKAIDLVAPTNPAVDLATALGELYHDGLPSLPGKTEGNIGDEYLNYQFGWSPTFQDGNSFLNAVTGMRKILAQYQRDNGKLVRRRFQFDPIRTSSSTRANGALAGSGSTPNAFLQRNGVWQTFTESVQTIWFSGAFTYYLPGDRFASMLYAGDKAYGLVPGIDTAWNLTPWSWLVDWFSSAGSILSNLSSYLENGLTMPWGYVMCHQRKTVHYMWTGDLRIGGNWVPQVVLFDIVYDTKQRRKATPFGFGVSWNGLNAFQLSILAALGISRVL